jgi:hypothetical protein
MALEVQAGRRDDAEQALQRRERHRGDIPSVLFNFNDLMRRLPTTPNSSPMSRLATVMLTVRQISTKFGSMTR